MKNWIIIIILLCFTFPAFAVEKEQAALGPMGSLGAFSETEKQILYTSLQEFLSTQYTLASQKSFERAMTEAFEELEYDECTEDQCFALIQQILQVDNLFLFNINREGSFTQLSLTRVNLDSQRLVSTAYCEGCGMGQLNAKVEGLVRKILGISTLPKNGSDSTSVKIAPIPVFSLDDLDTQAKQEEEKNASKEAEIRKQYQKMQARLKKNQEAMTAAFRKVKQYEQRKISSALKIKAWQRFRNTFSAQNSYSDEDDKQRQYTDQQIVYWKTDPKPLTQSPSGTVIDSKTGLMWQKGESKEMNWEDAKSYCRNLNLAGYSDWSLPDQETLRIMLAWNDGGHYTEKQLYKIFPEIKSSYYWSSPADVSSTSYETPYEWNVNFSNGYVSYHSKSYSYYVRCVRGGS